VPRQFYGDDAIPFSPPNPTGAYKPVKISVSKRQISASNRNKPDLSILLPYSTKITSKASTRDDGDAEAAEEDSILNTSSDDAPSSGMARVSIQPDEQLPKYLKFIYNFPMSCKITDKKKL